MKKLIVYSLFMLLYIQHYGQTSTPTIDSLAQGKVHWKQYREQTGLYEKGTFIDGKRHGTWQYTDSNGSVVLREKYKYGQYRSSVYYKNGKIIMTRNYKGKVIRRPDCGC